MALLHLCFLRLSNLILQLFSSVIQRDNLMASQQAPKNIRSTLANAKHLACISRFHLKIGICEKKSLYQNKQDSQHIFDINSLIHLGLERGKNES